MFKLAVCVSTLLIAIPAAFAADKPLPADRQSRLLERRPDADANKDGVLTKEEMRTAMAQPGGGPQGPGAVGPLAVLIPMDPAEILAASPQSDTNGDGKLDPQERRAYVESQRLSLEKDLIAQNPQIDANKDGALQPEEMRAGRDAVEQFVATRVLAAHPEADKDGDGKLSREELKALQMSRGPAGPPHSPAAHVDWLIQNFREVDTDRNGQLSVDELQAYKRQMTRGGEVGAGRPAERVRPSEKSEKSDQPAKNRQRAGKKAQRSGSPAEQG